MPVLRTLNDMIIAPEGGVDDNLLPWLVNVDVFMTPVASSGMNNVPVVNSSAIYNAYKNNFGSNLIGDSIEYDVALSAGTWTLEIITVTYDSAAIITAYLDGTSVGSTDLFYGPSAQWNTRKQITNIIVTTSGKKRLKLATTGKNASSLGYIFYLMHIQFKRTA